MRRQGQFETVPNRRPVDRCDNRFGQRLDRVAKRGEIWCAVFVLTALKACADAKDAAPAHQDDCDNRVVGFQFLQIASDVLSQRRCQRPGRRGHNFQDRYVVSTLDIHPYRGRDPVFSAHDVFYAITTERQARIHGPAEERGFQTGTLSQRSSSSASRDATALRGAGGETTSSPFGEFIL